MAYKVIQWATGNVGTSAVKAIASHPELELVGAWVHSENKDGRDIGEICGMGPVGIKATRDKEALLAMAADCVCYTIGRTWVQDPEATIDEMALILSSGKNLVNSTWPALVYPKGISKDIHEKLQQACLDGGTSFYTNGIDPGFGTVGMALSAMTMCREVRTIRMYELLNYGTWDAPELVTLFGFGKPYDPGCPIYTPGWTASVFKSSLVLLADILGVQIDDVVEWHDVVYADKDFDTSAIHVPAGTVSGVRFGINGIIGGEARFMVEHVTKLRDQDYPDIPFPGLGGYRVEVDGTPCVKLDLALTQHNDGGDPGAAALSTVAHTIVNAIPMVCQAEPGVLSYLDLPPHPSKNLWRGHL